MQDNDSACGFFTVGVTRDHLFNCNDRGNWVATIAARLGVTFGETGNWLLYVKGGGAFADARFGVRLRDDCLAVFRRPCATVILPSTTMTARGPAG